MSQSPQGYADWHSARNHPNGGDVDEYSPPVPGTLSLVVAEVVEDVAKEMFLTQTDLGRASGVSQSKISRAYRGQRVFTIDELAAICRALEVSVAAVVAEAEDRLRRSE